MPGRLSPTAPLDYGAAAELKIGRSPVITKNARLDAVFYPEPNVADMSNLARLGVGWDQCGQILLARHPDRSARR
jgi:hypothetical protein